MSWAEFFQAMKSRISIRRTTCIWLLSLLFVWTLPAIVQAQFSLRDQQRHDHHHGITARAAR